MGLTIYSVYLVTNGYPGIWMAVVFMMYNYVKLSDETQFAYSNVRDDNTVKVVVERPVDMGFDSATCILPSFEWLETSGFSAEEMSDLNNFMQHNAPLIMRLAGEATKSYA